jgi:pilus assembly protein CpaF
VWIDRGLGCERAGVTFASADAVRALAVRLASAAGRRLDDASPWVDARLASGARLHAVLPPIADGCTAISIRSVRASPFELDDLVASGMFGVDAASLLRRLVRARASLVISGATGSGKSTLLATLLSLVDPRERIVVIEESGELAPLHPHVVRLVERRVNVEGAGAVSLADLVRQSLRMRPDRIVLGECRGAELREVLTAYNTGHRGGMTTIHANGAADLPARLGALGALAGMSDRAVHLHVAAAFDAVVHLERGAGGSRRVAEIAVLEASGRGVRVSTAFSERDGRVVAGPGWPRLQALVGE